MSELRTASPPLDGGTAAPRTRPRLRLLGLSLAALLLTLGVLTYDIGPDLGSRGFWLVVDLRVEAVLTIVLIAPCQAVATVVFHTATSNRILTPSIMGFEALYVLIQTSLVFFLGARSLYETDGIGKVLLQSTLMVLFATVLYTWLFNGQFGSLHITLLVGVVLGIGMGSLSVFMQRLLTPSEFDLLAARLFGNISNSNADYLPYGFAIISVCLVLVFRRRHRLDAVALGRETAISLGLNYRREVTVLLVLTAVLISISTTMVGPLTFFGFIVATLTYQVAGSSEHRHLLPVSVALGISVLMGSYFLLHHVFETVGLLTVVIEFCGGIFFLITVLRKASL